MYLKLRYRMGAGSFFFNCRKSKYTGVYKSVDIRLNRDSRAMLVEQMAAVAKTRWPLGPVCAMKQSRSWRSVLAFGTKKVPVDVQYNTSAMFWTSLGIFDWHSYADLSVVADGQLNSVSEEDKSAGIVTMHRRLCGATQQLSRSAHALLEPRRCTHVCI